MGGSPSTGTLFPLKFEFQPITEKMIIYIYRKGIYRAETFLAIIWPKILAVTPTIISYGHTLVDSPVIGLVGAPLVHSVDSPVIGLVGALVLRSVDSRNSLDFSLSIALIHPS